MTEYYYEKLARCNKAGMSDKEAVEWIVTGLNNVKFRDYLSPLSKYARPNMLLPDLKSASHLLPNRMYHKDNKDHKDKNRKFNEDLLQLQGRRAYCEST